MNDKTAETLIDEAQQLVIDERKAIADKLAALDRFAKGVTKISTETRPSPTGSAVAGNFLNSSPMSVSNDDRICRVRSLFAETVQPHSIADIGRSEPLLVTIQEEFNEEIALALSPSTNHQFTPQLQRAICSATERCKSDLRVMDKGLAIEEDDLEYVAELRKSLPDKLSAAPDASEIHSTTLVNQYEKIEHCKRQCEQLTIDRQLTVHATINHSPEGNLSHSFLLDYIYQSLDVDYPVLSATIQLINHCETHQQTICERLIDN